MNLMPLFDHAWATLMHSLGGVNWQAAHAVRTLEVVSAIFGVVGAYLLAVKSRWAPLTFVLWLFSNVGWIAFGWLGGHWFLMLQNIAFAAINLLGIWTWRSMELVGNALHDDGQGEDA